MAVFHYISSISLDGFFGCLFGRTVSAGSAWSNVTISESSEIDTRLSSFLFDVSVLLRCSFCSSEGLVVSGAGSKCRRNFRFLRYLVPSVSCTTYDRGSSLSATTVAGLHRRSFGDWSIMGSPVFNGASSRVFLS